MQSLGIPTLTLARGLHSRHLKNLGAVVCGEARRAASHVDFPVGLLTLQRTQSASSLCLMQSQTDPDLHIVADDLCSLLNLGSIHDHHTLLR